MLRICPACVFLLTISPTLVWAGSGAASPELLAKREPELCAEVNDERSGGSFREEYAIWQERHERCCEEVFGDRENPAVLSDRERSLCGIVAEPWELSCEGGKASGKDSSPFEQHPDEAKRARLAETLPRQTAALASPDPAARRAALYALANLQTDAARDALRGVLEDGKRTSLDRSLAALGLGRMNDRDSVSPMLSVMQGARESDLPAFRLALRLLTGEDLGLTAAVWSEWWLAHGARRADPLRPPPKSDWLLTEYSRRLICKSLQLSAGADAERAVNFTFRDIRKMLLHETDILLLGEGEVREDGETREEKRLGVLVHLENRPRWEGFLDDMRCHASLRHLSDPRVRVELGGTASADEIRTPVMTGRLFRLSKQIRCVVGPGPILPEH